MSDKVKTPEERAEEWLDKHAEGVHGWWPGEVHSLAEKFREVEREAQAEIADEREMGPGLAHCSRCGLVIVCAGVDVEHVTEMRAQLVEVLKAADALREARAKLIKYQADMADDEADVDGDSLIAAYDAATKGIER